MWFINFKRNFVVLLFSWLLAIFIQMAGRCYLVFDNISFNLLSDNFTDTARLFKLGLIFDIRIASIALSLFLVISLLTSFNRSMNNCWSHIQKYLLSCILFITALFTIINIFYYKTYDRHIDVFIFGFFNDDTIAIIKTMWSDYPVIWISLSLGIILYLVLKVLSKIQITTQSLFNTKNSLSISIPFIIFTFAIAALGTRGSIGTFPLRQEDAQVSKIIIFNKFVPNGLIAFEWAFKAHKLENQFERFTKEQGDEIFYHFFDKKANSDLSIFNAITPYNKQAEQKKPHVIFNLMESMSSHLFTLDNPKRDLYGELRTHFDSDFVFWNFISEGNGTADSLNRLLVRSNISYISRSSAQNKKFLSNVFLPFKNNNYKIIFIYAGNGGWQNFSNFILNLGADEFIDQNTLMNEYPDAELYAWGVADEYMFKFAEKKLKEADDTNQPVMIMTLSITNHPPYELPKNNRRNLFPISQNEYERFKNFDNKKFLTVLNTFKYSNDMLGKFISNIKNSKIADHTIIAATGDHNIRGIGYPNSQETALGFSVPFYLYVPANYQNNINYNKNTIGSHKDIMPTIYNLALSNTSYYQMGCNMLSKKLDSKWCNIGYNEGAFISKYGIYDFHSRQFRAWNNINETNLLLNDEIAEPNLEQKQLINKWKNYSSLLSWQLSEQINNQ